MSSLAMLLMLAAPTQFDGVPVSDPALSASRGGFELPNGIDVAITVQTQTAVDGAVVLRTVFQVDHGSPTLDIYAPKPGETVASTSSTSTSSSASSSPIITFDRQGGIQVTPAVTMPTISVQTADKADADSQTNGLQLVDATHGALTDAGSITRSEQSGVDTVRLEGPDLSVIHFAGDAFGSLVANSGNDRAIDTTTAVSIDLRNAGPDVLGSAMLRAQDVATDAIAGRF